MVRTYRKLALALAGGVALAGCVVEERDHRDRDRDRGPPPQQEPVVVEERHDDRPPPPDRPPPQQQGEYGGLQYLGDFESVVHPGEMVLGQGWYKVRHGPMKLEGGPRGGFFIRGGGQNATVIKGDLELHGNGFTITNLTIDGDLEIHGDNHNLQNVIVRGKYRDKGHNNHHNQ